MIRRITRFVYNNSFKLLAVAIMFYLLSDQGLEVNIGNKEASETQLVSLQVSETQPISIKQKIGAWLSPTAAELERRWHSSRLFISAQLREHVGQKRVLENIDETTVNNFVKRFQRLAINEQTEFGIPASIIMAHSLLQSEAGSGEAARHGNNMFSILCTPDWQGKSFTDDAGICFRQYDSIATSFRDNSYFLTTGNFSHLKALPSTDYRNWAREIGKILRNNGSKNYGRRLIRAIELLELEKLDSIE